MIEKLCSRHCTPKKFIMDKFLWILIFSNLLALTRLQSIESSPETINAGDDVRLKCIYPKELKSAAKKYIWFLENQKVDLTDGHYEQNESELLIKKIQPLRTGRYKCQIIVDNGARMEIPHKLIRISGIDAPESQIYKFYNETKAIKEDVLKFTPKPTNKNFELGSSSKIHCKARGVSGDVKTFWMRGLNESLSQDVVDINGTLLFDRVALENKGQYTCFATDGEDTIQQTIQVGIMPRFEITPADNLIVNETQQIVLDCSATGSPKPTVKWDYEGKMITDEEGSRMHVHENGTLIINDAKAEDMGTYACTIGSPAGFKRKESNVVVNSPSEDSSNAVFVTCLLSFVYILLVVALMFWCRQRKRSRHSEEMENKNENDTTNDDLEESNNEKKPLNNSKSHDKVSRHNEKPLKIKNSSALVIDTLMISFDKIFETTKLGCGQFGEVLIGNVMDFDLTDFKKRVSKNVDEIQTQNKIPVMVRTLSKSADEESFAEFRRQIELFNKVNCSHVAKLLALSLESDHHHMILEHAQDLKSYINGNSVETKELIKFSAQLCTALESISNLKLTHRDIAMRNCMIVEGSTVKLSMISLSKDKHSKEYYRVKSFMLPIRHMAPELFADLDKIKYTTATDVYACGMTIWEILMGGKSIPFESMNNDELYQKLNTKTLEHEVLLKHEEIPNELHSILKKCWAVDASERPSPSELLNCVKNI